MKVKINNEVLKWARESVNLSIDDVVDKIKMKTFTKDDLVKFENGEQLPDLNLTKKLAKLYGISFDVLYMTSIPKNIQPKINDFRQLDTKLSRNAIFLMRKLIEHQEWVKSYLISNNAKELDFVGIISINTNIKDTIYKIKNALNIEINFNKDSKYNFDNIKELLENNNIFVSVGNSYNFNYRSSVEVKEIRRFAIADKIAPFIFVNSSDTDNAKLFTLIHELVHIFIGETGISNATFTDINKQNKIERYCNKVASEILIPKNIFNEYWTNFISGNIEEKISFISSKLPVSKLSILVKAKSFGYIEEDIFNQLFNKFSNVKFQNKILNGQPDPYYIKRNLNTKKFSNYVLDAYCDNNITLKDTCNLLSIKPYKLEKYIKRIQ
ncbi:XRE family transcriptional regulator [Brachyspira innocens]|uniref:XRE family transcriptional regulator n=1 Tax=Brachyspira innocens TaxID=13264 RepID=UPI0026E91C02|nr:XRE family transcriptional regulator [Brachyspira innocens]MDO6994745.1 XRE family transcriptional regulator [Brachyspira innocens]